MVGLLLNAADGIVTAIIDQKCDVSGDSGDCVSVENLQDCCDLLFTDSSAALNPDLRVRMAKLCIELSRHTPHSTLHMTARDEEEGHITAAKESKAISSIEK
jgi:hypothetical protein